MSETIPFVRLLYRLCFVIAARVLAEFAAGTQHAESALRFLENVQETLGPELVQELRDASKNRGGEQYRPDPDKVTCANNISLALFP